MVDKYPRGKFPPLATDTEVNNNYCYVIYYIASSVYLQNQNLDKKICSLK